MTLAVMAIAKAGFTLELWVDEADAIVVMDGDNDDISWLVAVRMSEDIRVPDPGTAGNVEAFDNCVSDACAVDAVALTQASILH